MEIWLAVALLAASYVAATPINLPRPSDQHPLTAPYDEADLWKSVPNDGPLYNKELADGHQLSMDTVYRYLKYLVDRNCNMSSANMWKVSRILRAVENRTATDPKVVVKLPD